MKKILQILMIFLTILLPIMIIFTVPYIIVDKHVLIGYNTDFVDKYEAESLFGDYTNQVVVENKVDTTKLGTYVIYYKLKFGPFTIVDKKEVEVVDTKKPTIELTKGNEVTVCPNTKYVEDGYKAIDDYDKDITDKVEIISDENEIKYRVSDSSGNLEEVVRKINYADSEKPSISLKGKAEITLYKNTKYVESGYTASDNCDGDLTSKVVVENKVDTTKTGSYEVKYKVSDSSSNETIVSRKVNVVNRPVYSGPNDGVIYLTFDDGPSNLTSSILDLLDRQNVKATFFVTSSVNNYPSVLKRAYNSGHSIALHTYTHDYGYVYSGVDNYFNDLQKIDNAVYNIIGVHSKVIRFPGGSSNTISRNYYNGIMSILTQEVVNRGYNYFDWNVDSNDAGSDINNSNNIYNNVVNNLSHTKSNVILMHDSSGHNATLNALEGIIEYAKANGYTFATIKSDTSPVRHGVNN